MDSRTDQQLLREYAGRRSEAAFSEVVRRYLDFVHSAALRLVRHTQMAASGEEAAVRWLVNNYARR